MTLGGYGTWGHGALVLPLDDSQAADTPLIELADPALDAATKFLSAVIELQVGAALRAYLLREGDKTPSAVGTTVNVEPVPALYASRAKFPFFALYRKSEQHTGHTVVWDKDLGEWEFAYVLPPLMPEPQERIAPILRAVARTIGYAMKFGRHPLYESGRNVWGDASIMSARLVSVRYDRYEPISAATDSKAEQFYRAIVGTLEVVERNMPVAGAFETFAGADVSIDQKPPNQAAYTGVATFLATAPPTIDSVSPTSGTKAGGTTIALVGSNFRAGMRLLVGDIAVPITFIDATHASAVTPAHDASPDFMADVVLITPEGEVARKPAGFTFTTP